jgi:probable addiction module antidote protein
MRCNAGQRLLAKTAHCDVAEFLETPEEMAAYLEDCIQESDEDAAFIAKALGDIARSNGMPQVTGETGLSRKVCIRHSQSVGAQALTRT